MLVFRSCFKCGDKELLMSTLKVIYGLLFYKDFMLFLFVFQIVAEMVHLKQLLLQKDRWIVCLGTQMNQLLKASHQFYLLILGSNDTIDQRMAKRSTFGVAIFNFIALHRATYNLKLLRLKWYIVRFDLNNQIVV